MSKGSPVWITIISSVTSFVMTSLTVFFLGWNIHNQILDQVDQKIQAAVSYRLEKEPAATQLKDQSEAIKAMSVKIEGYSSNLTTIESKVNTIIEILQPKKLSNLGGNTWTTKK